MSELPKLVAPNTKRSENGWCREKNIVVAPQHATVTSWRLMVWIISAKVAYKILSIEVFIVDRQNNNKHWKLTHIIGGSETQNSVIASNRSISTFLPAIYRHGYHIIFVSSRIRVGISNYLNTMWPLIDMWAWCDLGPFSQWNITFFFYRKIGI